MLISSGAARTCSLSFALRGGAQQVHERAGRVVAAAAVAELGDFDDAAAGPGRCSRSRQRRVEALFFAFGFAVGGVGEDVDADRQCVGDVLRHSSRVAAPLAGLGELPVAREILVGSKRRTCGSHTRRPTAGRRKAIRAAPYPACARSDGRA